jgi:hypothetical protein
LGWHIEPDDALFLAPNLSVEHEPKRQRLDDWVFNEESMNYHDLYSQQMVLPHATFIIGRKTCR